ncbi:response regulator [Eleftheria terrae]|uniref:response regulator n=1 Tax=Eleftheria terrae TaxID=1597781 RepID=UPI00263BA883|nr:response regulator [Eleftheria terrae]WKB54825.1 response regulator [Eleftheria terrae]
MTPTLRLLLVDDHSLFRRGLAALLADEPGWQVAGQAADASEALRCAAELQPDLILLDNHLPGVRGVDAVPGLREVAPRARVLLLTVSEEGEDLAAALKAGASGYLLKTIEREALVSGIVRALQGELVVSPQMTGKLMDALRGGGAPPAVPVEDEPGDGLSPRELEILAEIAQGASNKGIARTLGIAETTVKIHVQRILRKLKLSSRVQAAVYATERGIDKQ